MKTNYERSQVNIMAPVGSYDCLYAAIAGGANSVYFGVENLNMRSHSSANFSLNDLAQIASICKKNHVESYVTVNTIIYNNEIDQMHRILDSAKKEGVSAVIAADMSVLEYAKQIDMPVHISTQANISNSAAVNFFSRYADVIVLARELNLNQVKKIYDDIAENNICGPRNKLVQIEMFCHGALCMAISGKCYLSLHSHGVSANRGECYQLCRRSYRAFETETGTELQLENNYIMSPKDLCTIQFLPLMLESGVSVFKIEGRARPAEYVKKACLCYNSAFNAIESGTYDDALKDKLVCELQTVFNRGFWSGYYQGAEIGQWSNVYGSQATRKKTYCAKATHYFDRIKVGEFLLEYGTIKIGDTIMIIGPKTGAEEFTVESIRIGKEGKSAEYAVKGEVFSIPVPCRIRLADRLYSWEKTNER